MILQSLYPWCARLYNCNIQKAFIILLLLSVFESLVNICHNIIDEFCTQIREIDDIYELVGCFSKSARSWPWSSSLVRTCSIQAIINKAVYNKYTAGFLPNA